MLVRRIQNQELSCLARRVYKQPRLGLPGLAKEVTDICEAISIPDINYYSVRKDKIQERNFYHTY